MRRGGVAGKEASAGPEGEVDQGDQGGHLDERADDAGQGLAGGADDDGDGQLEVVGDGV